MTDIHDDAEWTTFTVPRALSALKDLLIAIFAVISAYSGGLYGLTTYGWLAAPLALLLVCFAGSCVGSCLRSLRALMRRHPDNGPSIEALP